MANPLIDRVCSNSAYRVEVRDYLFGQYRIMLIDRYRRHDVNYSVRQLCTYNRAKMHETAEMLCLAVDPEAACEALAKPWNCEYQGGRIRLDSSEEST